MNNFDAELERARTVWQTKAEVDILHSELASYYRTGRHLTDRKTVAELWRQIEHREAVLILEGVSVA